MENPQTLSEKLGATLFALLFAVCFSWGGLVHGVPGLAEPGLAWWQARSYVPVPAVVTTVSLRTENDADVGRVYLATASFAYRYQGRDYASRRIGLSDAADNLGSYQRDMHARLKRARDSGATLTLWVDPAAPAQALFDRELRWRLVLMLLPFAILFPAIGAGAWHVIWRMWRGPRAGGAGLPDGWQLQSKPARYAPLATALASGVWVLICCPLMASEIDRPWQQWRWWVALELLFPAAGLGIACAAWRMWRAQRRIGRPALELLQCGVPGGAPLRGRMHFQPPLGSRLPATQLMHAVKIELQLQLETHSGDDSTETTLLQLPVLNTTLARGSVSVDFSAAVPEQLPQAGRSRPGQVELRWMLVLKTADTEVAFLLPQPADGDAALIDSASPARPQWTSHNR